MSNYKQLVSDYSRLIKSLDSILKIIEDFRNESVLNIEYKSYVFSESDWNGTDIWLILHQDWFKDMVKVWFDIEVGYGNYDGVKVLRSSEGKEKNMCEYVILSWD